MNPATMRLRIHPSSGSRGTPSKSKTSYTDGQVSSLNAAGVAMLVRMVQITCLMTFACQMASAQDQGKTTNEGRSSLIDVGQIQVPEGSVTDVLEFLEEISQLQQDIAADYRSAMTKITSAQAEASNRLLESADSLSDEQFAKAAAFGLSNRLRNVAQANAEEQRRLLDLVKRQLSIGVKRGNSQQSDLSNATMLATSRTANAALNASFSGNKSTKAMAKPATSRIARPLSASWAGSKGRGVDIRIGSI